MSGAGPVGALIAYALVGTVAFASVSRDDVGRYPPLTRLVSSLCSVGEMTSHAPIAGSFPYYGMLI